MNAAQAGGDHRIDAPTPMHAPTKTFVSITMIIEAVVSKCHRPASRDSALRSPARPPDNPPNKRRNA